MRKHYLTLLVLGFFMCLTGCQTIDGPKFVSVETPSEGEAIVYIYKPLTYGKSIYLILANGEPVTKLMRGGYFIYHTPPGELKIAADKQARIGELLEVFDIEPDKKITLLVEAGMRYYVKIVGALNVRLVQVDEQSALGELPECRQLAVFEEE